MVSFLWRSRSLGIMIDIWRIYADLARVRDSRTYYHCGVTTIIYIFVYHHQFSRDCAAKRVLLDISVKTFIIYWFGSNSNGFCPSLDLHIFSFFINWFLSNVLHRKITLRSHHYRKHVILWQFLLRFVGGFKPSQINLWRFRYDHHEQFCDPHKMMRLFVVIFNAFCRGVWKHHKII